MRNICFFHSADLDGHCSGAIVRHFIPDVELIGINYGDEFPWEIIGHREATVYMVDFCLQPFEDMMKLDEIALHTVLIDHHKTTAEELSKEFGGEVVINMKRAGCELAWDFFCSRPMPLAVHFLGRYDVWDHSDQRTLPFQYGMRMEKTYPADNDAMLMWTKLIAAGGEYGMSEVERILDKGSTVLEYQRQFNEKYARAACFPTELDGLCVIACNAQLTNSQLFDSVWDPGTYDAMVTFGWRKGKWTVSLYTNKEGVDVSEIAKAHGGGGHKGAAGFQCQELPEGFLKGV